MSKTYKVSWRSHNSMGGDTHESETVTDDRGWEFVSILVRDLLKPDGPMERFPVLEINVKLKED
jgi:hypothetical protein